MKAGEVAEVIGAYVGEIKIVSGSRVAATTDERRAREAMLALKARGVQHVSTISGIDRGEVITLVYHLDCEPAVLSLKLDLPKDSPRVRSIADIFPGAALYERDVMEMLGVRVEGHPDPRRLFLPEDWPTGKHPLRREAEL